MTKFRVQLRREVAEGVFLEIDAGSEQEVKDLLKSQVMIEELPWRRAITGEEEIVGIWPQDENGPPSET